MTNKHNKQELLSIHEAAALLKVSTKTLRRWEAKQFLVPERTEGKHRRYHLEDIVALKNEKSHKKQSLKTKQEPALVHEMKSNTLSKPQQTDEVIKYKTPQEVFAQQVSVEEEQPKQSQANNNGKRILSRILLVVGLFVITATAVKAIAPQIQSIVGIPAEIASNTNTANVLADTTTLQDLTFNLNVPTKINADLQVNGNATASGNLTVQGQNNQIAGILTLTGNQLSSSGDLVINPVGGGVRVGSAGNASIDLAGGDLFIQDQLQVGRSITIGGDTISDFAGTGLQVTNGILQTTLGTTIENAEIADNTITESKLSVTNDASSGKVLSYDVDGRFKWVDQTPASTNTSPFQTTSNVVNLVTATDDVTIGSTTDLGKLAVTGDSDEVQFLVRGNATQTSNLIAVQNSSATNLFTVDNSGNVVMGGSLTVNSDAISDFTGNGLTLSAGSLTIQLPAATNALSSTITSGSGLEILSSGLTLLQGCADGQILKWNEATDMWGCSNDSGATSAIINVENNGVAVGTNIDTLNFTTDFSVTESPSGTDNIAVADDALNFSELADSLVLDASTSIAFGGSNYSLTFTNNGSGDEIHNLSSTGDLAIQDNGTPFATFDDAGGITFTPNGTSNLTVNTDSDSKLKVTGLSSGSGSALCLDASNNLVTCTTGAGGVSGSGTSGQVAYFNGATSIASEASGFSWDATNNKLGIGTDTPDGVLHVTGAAVGKALAIFNETGDQNILTASASGTTVLTVARSGDITASSSVANADSIKISPNGSGANSFTGTLTSADLTANRTWTLPDVAGTVILSGHSFTSDVTGTLGAGGTTALTISADAVALGTDTTGNYIATIAGSSQVGVSGSGSESAAVTLSINGDSIGTAELASSLAFSDGDFIDLSGINGSSTTEGLKLPQNATACSAQTADGEICWDNSTDTLYVGTGSGVSAIGGGSSFVSFTLAGTSGTPQTISNGNTATIAAGTGITTTAGATDTVTVAATLGTSIANSEIDSNTIDWNSISDAMTLDANTTISAASALSLSIGNNVTLTTTGTGSIVATDLSCADCVALATETTGNYVATVTGNSQVGVSGSGSENAGVSLSINNDSIGTGQLAASLAFSDGDFLDLSAINTSSTTEGFKLPQNATACSAGTAEGQVCWDSSTDTLYVGNGTTVSAIGGGSSFTSFTAAGDTGSNQTISNGNTLSIVGGTNGIDTVGSATDTITLNLDTTEIGTTIFGGGSAFTWTFDASAGTDTTLAFGNNSATFTGNTFTVASSTTNADSISIIPQNGTATNPFTGTITSADLTSAQTWTFPNDTGTVCLTSGNCAGVGGGLTGTGTSGQIAYFNGTGTLTSEATGFSWDATNNRLGIGTDTPNGVLHVTGAATGKALAIFNETGDQNILTASASGTTVASISRTGQLTLNTTTANADKIAVVGNSSGAATSTGSITTADLTSDQTWTFPNDTGTVCLTSGNCAGVGGVGTMNNFIAAGDTGSNQTISDGNTLSIVGGTNGIDTVGSATDTITLNLDTTEIGTTTYGSGSAITWTFDASAGTDTTLAFGNNTGTFTGNTFTVASSTTNADSIAIIPQNGTATASFTGTITSNDLTAARTYTLPDRSGTYSLSGDTFTSDVTGTLSATGATALTIASDAVALGTDTTGNYVATITGNTQVGVSGSGSENAGVSLSINSNSIDSAQLAAALTFSDGDFLDLSAINTSSTTEGLKLPQNATACSAGTAEGQICWDSSTDTLYVGNGTTASAIGGGTSFTSFTAAGDTGSNQTISNGDTLSIVGGTNGIDTVGSATDIITLNLDTTEIGSTTFGSGSASTWTFDASGGTDTTIAFGDNTQTFTTATATFSGNETIQGTTGLTLSGAAANISISGTGNHIISTSNAGSNLTINTATTGALTLDSGTTGNVNLGTGTNAKTVAIGNSTGATALTLTSGTGSQTFTSSNATGTTTSGAFVFTDNALTTGTGAYLNSSSLTSGNLLSLASTSTVLSSGKLASFDWSPGSATTASGDLFNINIGTFGTTTGNIFSVSDTGSNLFSVSETGITANVPAAFNAAGDVTMAYDLQFTNQTASFIKALGPLTVDAGESFESNDLTLKTYNSGRIIGDVSNSGGVLISSNPSSVNSIGLLNIDGAATGKALAIFNETGNQNILTASASGTTVASISRTGQLTLNTTTTNADKLALVGNATGSNSYTGTISTADLTVGDQTFNLPDLAAATSATICVSTGNCAGLGGTLSGSGTAGQIAFFSTASNVTSETSGFGWDSTNKLFTVTSTNATGAANTLTDNSLTSGKVLSLVSTNSGQTSGKFIDIAQTGVTTGFTGNLINLSSTSTTGAATFINLAADASTVGVGEKISMNAVTSGTLLSLASSGVGQTTGKYIDIAQTGVTTGYTGNLINLSSSSTTGAATFINLAADASTIGIGEKISMNALTSGTLLSLASTSNGQTTGKFIDIAQTGVTTGFTGNLISLSSTSTTGAATFLNLTANASTVGTGEAISMTGQTTGTGLSITGGGANLAAGGELVDLVMGAATAGNGINIATTGAYAGTGLATLSATNLTSGTLLSIASSSTGQTTDKFIDLSQTGVTTGFTGNLINLSSTSTTGAATFLNLTANASTVGTGEAISMNALTTGKLLSLSSSSAGQTTGKFIDIAQTGVTTGFTGNLINLSSSSTTGAATFINLAADASTIGIGEKISMNALTSGSLLSLASTSNGQTTGKFIDIAQTGVTTGFTGNLINLSSSSTTGAATFINLAADASTVGIGEKISMNALTSGSLLSLASSSAGQTTGKFIDIAQTGVTTGFTGNLVNLSSSSTTGAATFINLAADASTVGTGEKISMNALTSGKLLSLTSSSASQTTGKFIDIAQTGVTTGFTGNLINLSSSSTTGAATFINLTANSSTTGIGQAISMNALTTGSDLSLSSSSTALTTGSLITSSLTGASAFTGNLNYFDWTPGSSTTATGDLLRIHIGPNGTAANLFNVVDDTTSLFSVSETAVTSTLPANFTAAGDVAMAYDLQFTNQTASYIKSNAPLTLDTGESFESNNLTLQTYNVGNILLNTGSSSTGTGKVGVGPSVTPVGLLHVSNVNESSSGLIGKALAIFDQGESQDILSASKSGTPKFVVDSSGIPYMGSNASAGANTAACWNSATLNGTTLYKIGDCPGTPADIAEWYAAETDVQPGDAVALSTQGFTYEGLGADPYTHQESTLGTRHTNILKKAQPGDNVVGIISTGAFQTFGEDIKNAVDTSGRNDIKPVPLALTGRVPANVDFAGGSIAAGDKLMITSNGKIAKASGTGTTLGTALESWSQGSSQSQIMVLVSEGFTAEGFDNNSASDSGQLAIRITSLENDFNTIVRGSLTASDSGVLANFDKVNTNSLSVLGDTVLADTVINGKLNVGSIQIDNVNNSIDAIGTLKIQSLALANIEFENGQITFDTTGNVVVNTITAQKYKVAGASAGSDTLTAGSTQIFVSSTAVTANSLVFVTAKQATSQPLAVTEKQDGLGFLVTVPHTNASNIDFDWFILDKAN